MQRKNSILRSARNGMAMIMAISVIVIIATILALSLSLTTQTAKRTADLYLYEQSVLLSQSAAEYAMLKISQVAPCSLPNIPTITYNTTHTIDVSMQYISTAGSACNTNAIGGLNYGITTYPKSDGTVLMDITVTSNVGSEPIRYFRRSIQKL